MTVHPETDRYLSPYNDQWFWRWDRESEDPAADAVVWADGSTIAFRAEIRAVLEALAPGDLPEFDEIVLLLAACRENWQDCRRQLRNLTTDPEYSDLGVLIRQLDLVHSLPARLRTSVQAKALLVETVFESVRKLRRWQAGARILADFERFDPHASSWEGSSDLLDGTLRWLMRNRTCDLVTALIRTDAETLRLRLQTGLDQLVKAANLVLPVADRARSLLTELDKDPEWQGLARLTRRLMAAVSLPHPVSDLEDLSLGGVSDITNRSQLDRLLLSELAQDDLMFTARLAIGELLYLRREAPPRPQAETRSLLVDCGLRLWGVPRIFSTAVALALIATSRKTGDVQVFRAAGRKVEPVDLLTQNGLIAHLAALQPAMHPGEALPAFLSARGGEAQPVTPILITAKPTLSDPEFRDCLREHSAQGLYLASVTREGHFQLSWFGEHKRRSLSEARLSLNEILQPAQPSTHQHERLLDIRLPRIFQTHPFPLRLRYPLSSAVSATVASWEKFLVVTHDRRLLCFSGLREYSTQLSDFVPAGRICWLSSDKVPHLVRAVIFASPHHEPTLLEINGSEGTCRLQPLAGSSRRAQLGAALHQGAVFLVGRCHAEAFSLEGQCIARLRLPRTVHYVPPGRFFQEPTQQKWYALSLKGTQIRLEEVTCATGDPMPPVMQLIDVADCDGPFGIDQRGHTFDTTSGQWHSYSVDPGCHKDFNTSSLQQILAISRDGRHAAVRFQAFDGVIRPSLKGAEHLCVVNGKHGLPLWNVRPQIAIELNAWILYCLSMENKPNRRISPPAFRLFGSSSSLPTHFMHVAVSAEGKILLTARSGLRLSLDRSLFWSQSLPQARSVSSRPIDASPGTDFTAVRTPYLAGRSIRLHVAEFPDGSRIYVDSRGLLHLVSASVDLPEVTLVLPNRDKSELSGWCSNGTHFGDGWFSTAPVLATCTIQSVFDQVIIPFVRHIVCPPGH